MRKPLKYLYMKKMTVMTIILVVLFLLNILQFAWDNIAYHYPVAVPDEQTARLVGAALFGGGRDFESLTVTYLPKKKAWWIYKPLPEGYVGGPYSVIIRERDGKVVYFYRGM